VSLPEPKTHFSQRREGTQSSQSSLSSGWNSHTASACEFRVPLLVERVDLKYEDKAMMNWIGVLLLSINLSAIAFVGCRKEAPEPPSKPKYEFKGDEGEIKGVMKFDGRPPARVRIDLSQDPNCANALSSKWVDDRLVEDGKCKTCLSIVLKYRTIATKRRKKDLPAFA
jgi:hypothetical protein